jgi:hypothetical protein
MKRRWVLLVGLAALALTGCAPDENPLVRTPGASGIAGFWMGLWHGMICPIALVVSWFNSSVSMYEVHNNGAWYNSGFVMGAGAWGVLRGSPKKLRSYSDGEIRMEAERRGLLAPPRGE